MAVAPYSVPEQAALSVLIKDDGNVIEALVAAASTIAVVSPFRNGFGGNGFWVISEPNQQVIAVECGRMAGASVSREFYHEKNLKTIPVAAHRRQILSRFSAASSMAEECLAMILISSADKMKRFAMPAPTCEILPEFSKVVLIHAVTVQSPV